MKKNYQKPTMNVVKLQHSGIICTSQVTDTSNNASLRYVGSDENYSDGAQ